VPVERVDRGGRSPITGRGRRSCTLWSISRGRSHRAGDGDAARTDVIDTLREPRCDGREKNRRAGRIRGRGEDRAAGFGWRRGLCCHGLALNVDMDLAPFSVIDPCGIPASRSRRPARTESSPGATEMGDELAHRIARLIDK